MMRSENILFHVLLKVAIRSLYERRIYNATIKVFI